MISVPLLVPKRKTFGLLAHCVRYLCAFTPLKNGDFVTTSSRFLAPLDAKNILNNHENTICEAQRAIQKRWAT